MEIVSDPHVIHTPDRTTIFVHFLASTTTERGLRAAIGLDKQPSIPANLGLAKLDSYQDTVFLQLAQCNAMFVCYNDHNAQILQITFKEYIGLLHFFHNEWSAIESKLCSQAQVMRKSDDPIYISINTWCFIITFFLNTKQNWAPGSCFKPGLIPRIWSTTEFSYGLRWLKEADPLSCPIMSSLNWPMAPTPFMSWLASVKSIKGPRGNFLCQSRHATRKDINLCPFSKSQCEFNHLCEQFWQDPSPAENFPPSWGL